MKYEAPEPYRCSSKVSRALGLGLLAESPRSNHLVISDGDNGFDGRRCRRGNSLYGGGSHDCREMLFVD